MNINPMGTQNNAGNTKIIELKGIVADVLGVPEDVTIMITELKCGEPGCPPVETVIAVLAASEKNFKFKIHKPLSEVKREDVIRAVVLAERQST